MEKENGENQKLEILQKKKMFKQKKNIFYW